MMYQFILFSLMLLTFASIGISQAPPPPPPPPPPLIYEPPSTSDFVDFMADDGFFTVTFPGEPTKKVEKQGQATMTSYRVYRKGSNSIVGTTSLAADMTGNSDQLFSAIREAIGQRQRTKIVAERDIELRGFIGREFEVDYGLRYGIIRIYLSGAKVIEIQCDVTNWSLLSDKVKSEWRTEANRFFSSLIINK